MNSFDEKRRYTNGELVMLLYKLIQENPTMRFSQILSNFDFVKQDQIDDISGGTTQFWQDEFYLEPTELLKRVKTAIERINNAKV